MITSVEIRNFKRFSQVDVSLRGVTVLAGLNGTGKSTLIQSLLLARYTSEFRESRIVPLNGPFGLALGEASELLHPTAQNQVITVVLGAESQRYEYRFSVPDERSLNLRVVERPDPVPTMFTDRGRLTYLNAERLGPRDQLEVTAADATELGVGDRGQFTAQVLAARQSQAVAQPLRHPTDTPEHGVTTLLTQVEYWVKDILRPMRISAQWPAGLRPPEVARARTLRPAAIRNRDAGKSV